MKTFSRFISGLVILCLAIPFAMPINVQADSMKLTDPVNITILHTNDFHGNLEINSGGSASNPGMARVAKVINGIRTTLGPENVLLLDGGDEMQGSLISNLTLGEATVEVFNAMEYDAATFGNHEFDWGQDVLRDRTSQADYPFLSANIVAGDCAGWTTPDFAEPYKVLLAGPPGNQARVGVIGVSTTETPTITIAEATAGLCFKDPAESILHYYDELKAISDVIVVLSHLGYTDGGYGYGIPVYGDQTLAQKLIDAGKSVPLIIGGHSHTDVTVPITLVGGKTAVVQARYNGRQVGRADLTVSPDGTATVSWSKIPVPTSTIDPPPPFPDPFADPAIETLIQAYVTDPDYVALINTEIGWTGVGILRNYNGDSLMGAFVNDAIYNDLNTDGFSENDVDMVFNNPGGLRADIVCATYPCKLNFGMMFSILPFGNQTIVGDMTGAQIMELLNQSALLNKGAIQVSGIRYKFYRYFGGVPAKAYAWGGFDACVVDKETGDCNPLELDHTYRIATNEFLAPAGQDSFTAFKYVTNISYWGDMLDGVNRWVSANYTVDNPYNGTLDGRITRDGNDAGGSIVPLTILHHNDSHGNLVKGTYVGYTQLATLIKQEKAYNPNRTILLSSGDNIQGDSMSYFFKTAALGYTSDGTALPPALQIQPLIAAFNTMGYDAMTLGNHEFNFGSQIFTSVLSQATFPILQANVDDDTGSYGLAEVPVEDFVEKTIGPEGIKVAILGIGNHRIPNYELPSNIPGLTFTSPIDTAQILADELGPTNDVVIALTHIGFTENPGSVEIDTNVDTAMARQVYGLDAIIGGHSHTNPAIGFGLTKYLPTIIAGPENTPVIVNHAYRYNNTLGEVIIGLRENGIGGYEVVSRAGAYLTVTTTVVADPIIKAILDPYVTLLSSYNNTEIGQTTVPLDALLAFTQETNAANLQADAGVFELEEKNGIPVDFHLSGAMTNRKVADLATIDSPVILKVADMFSLMPYENSLVVMNMNGPQLKAVLERAYRNYYYYKYVPGYGGYSYYTTCMIDINAGGKITYNDRFPAAYDPNQQYVVSLEFNGHNVDFSDAATYYRVSTVNYLAAGSCNFNNNGVSLWPLNQIAEDTQFYVRDAVIDYVIDKGTISPMIEGRLVFINDFEGPIISITNPEPITYLHTSSFRINFAVTDGGSGIRTIIADIDGVPVTNGQLIDLLTLPLGPHVFTVRAVDNAWNETSVSVNFSITATIESLKTLVTRFYLEGKFKNKGVYTGIMKLVTQAELMIAKGNIKTAIYMLKAVLAQVRALDKKMTPEAARILIQDVTWVLQSLLNR